MLIKNYLDTIKSILAQKYGPIMTKESIWWSEFSVMDHDGLFLSWITIETIKVHESSVREVIRFSSNKGLFGITIFPQLFLNM